MIVQLIILVIAAYMAIVIILLKNILKQQKTLEEKNIIAIKEKEQKKVTIKKEKVAPERTLERRIRTFLRENEGVHFNETELRIKIIIDTSDAVIFHRTLIAVAYYQRQDGYSITNGYSKSLSKDLCYCYKKPEKQ